MLLIHSTILMCCYALYLCYFSPLYQSSSTDESTVLRKKRAVLADGEKFNLMIVINWIFCPFTPRMYATEKGTLNNFYSWKEILGNNKKV